MDVAPNQGAYDSTLQIGALLSKSECERQECCTCYYHGDDEATETSLCRFDKKKTTAAANFVF